MLDLSYFQNQNSNVQGFFNGGTWQTWIKPRGAKLVNIICVGSGAGGGGGFQSASTPRGGGGGGGTGATARLIINANLLPDILYVLPGIGGAGGLGGTTATAGSPGQNSFVTLIPSTGSVSNVVLRSGTNGATGGGAGTTAGGTAGSAETISVIANNIFANLGTFTFQAGLGAAIGGTANGGALVYGSYTTGGGGGGGTGTGTGIAGNGVLPQVVAADVNTNGQSNLNFYRPILILIGGMGGGGSTAAGTNGGNGGNGSPGTGGGGGGASSNTGVNAGNGGRGGNGFVIITTSL
jgi:hypothetical protein